MSSVIESTDDLVVSVDRWPTGRSVLDIRLNPILGEGGQVMGLTLFGRDITARRDAETRLGELHRTLVDVSRGAGMAEIASGVLHQPHGRATPQVPS